MRRSDQVCDRRRALQTLAAAGAAAWLARPLPAADRPEPDLALVDHDGLVAAVAARRGRVVVLDCWSTSCPPCVRDFPRLVALAKAHPREVACLSLALEYEGIGTAEEVLPRVRLFLAKVGAHDVVNLVARDEADVMYRKLDLVSVPAVSVWRPDGTLAVRYDDDFAARTLGRPFTYDDVEATVAELLAAPRP
jgi:thiol-disulfide isomerase/thioredoxin